MDGIRIGNRGQQLTVRGMLLPFGSHIVICDEARIAEPMGLPKGFFQIICLLRE